MTTFTSTDWMEAMETNGFATSVEYEVIIRDGEKIVRATCEPQNRFWELKYVDKVKGLWTILDTGFITL
jgi:hypothetical protein